MKKTQNPFDHKSGESSQAWQSGYEALDLVLNPYSKLDKNLHSVWDQGKQAKLEDLKSIPAGPYCYNENGTCPYWYLKERQVGGCGLLEAYDYDGSDKASLLWDQVKECGVNSRDDE
jgi:hypothetical protein